MASGSRGYGVRFQLEGGEFEVQVPWLHENAELHPAKVFEDFHTRRSSGYVCT